LLQQHDAFTHDLPVTNLDRALQRSLSCAQMLTQINALWRRETVISFTPL
jgi:hypothetical protein